MSNKHSHTFKKFNELVRKKGEKGLKLFIIFKTVKSKVIDELDKDYDSEKLENSMDNINSQCIELSREIFSKGGEEPTEDEIRKIIEEIIKML